MLRCDTQGVREVRLISSDLRALPAAFLRARLEIGHFLTFYDSIMFEPLPHTCIPEKRAAYATVLP